MTLHYYLQVAVSIEIDDLPTDEDERDEAIEAKDAEYQTALYHSVQLSSNIDNATLKVSSVELAHKD